MSNPIRLVEKEACWEIDVNRGTVTRCLIDNQFTIEVAETDCTLAVGFEGEFTYTLVEGTNHLREYKLEAMQPNRLYPVLSVLHKSIELVIAYKSGDIAVRFSDGSSLTATSDPNYESWHINGADGLLIVCAPGGELAVWLPKHDK